MSQLERTYPEIWSEFSNGNWVAIKNNIPFCAIGPDHALEQFNRWMKVTRGLVGITLNKNTRNHELSRAILKMQAKNAQKLVSITEGFINPFSYQENAIINLVT